MTTDQQPVRAWFRRRQVLVPTWRGWLLLALILALLAVGAVLGISPFLCVTKPVENGLLVVEGWDRDHAMRQVVAEFRSKPYGKIYVTGGPLDYGLYLSDYGTFAQRGAAVLLTLGLTTNEVQAVPAPETRRDRTYTSAVALATWFREHGIEARSIQLMTEGPHARRSRLLYEKAFGPGVRIGITAIPDPEYDPTRWWRSSLGVRGVIDEAIAYVYARFFFWTSAPPRTHAGNYTARP